MCSNCYNGCAEVSSDKCVRYTGVNVPLLGISNGDTLLYVEQQLIAYLSSALDGTGIKITFAPSIICDLIKKYLPTCGDVSLLDVLITLVKSICDLQEQVAAIKSDIDTLNADYDVDCLTGVTNSSDTHSILQAVITELCSVSSDLAALTLDVATNYVKIADVDSYIADYLASVAPANKAYTKMLPYSPVPYFNSLSGYPTPSDQLSTTGEGTGYWEKVYICNGLSTTPDLRGRTVVGAIVGVGGAALSPAVDPANPFNPNYSIGSTAGANYVTLTPAQIPPHTHPSTVGDPGHIHPTAQFYSRPLNYGSENSTPALQKQLGANSTLGTPDTLNIGTSAQTGVSVTVENNVGGGGAHANNQPALACYYIMYKP